MNAKQAYTQAIKAQYKKAATLIEFQSGLGGGSATLDIKQLNSEVQSRLQRDGYKVASTGGKTVISWHHVGPAWGAAAKTAKRPAKKKARR